MKKFLLIVLLFTIIACSDDEESTEDPNESFFPALSYLQSQAAHIDTSVYPILKIETTGNQVDTEYIRREEFREYAKDFLTIPDITKKKLKKRYEESRLYDETLESFVLTYIPKPKEDVEIQRQEVIIKPSTGKGDKVEMIYIDRVIEKRDSTILKKMTWYVNERFQITTVIQKPKKPDQIKTLQVIWDNYQPPVK